MIQSEIAIQTARIEFSQGDTYAYLQPLADLETANLIRGGMSYDEAASLNREYINWSMTGDDKRCIEQWLRVNPRKRVEVKSDSTIDYVGDSRPANGEYDVPSLYSDAWAYCRGARGFLKSGNAVGWIAFGAGVIGVVALFKQKSSG